MATKDNNLRVPNPPKAIQRELGPLNPPQVREERRPISSPSQEASSENASINDRMEDGATQRIHVEMLRRSAVEEPSGSEPLMLRNVRLKGFDDNPLPDDAKTKVQEKTGRRPQGADDNIAKQNTPVRAKPRFYDFDEDAITKKIVVNRIVTVSPSKFGGKPEKVVRVETVNADNRNYNFSSITDARYRALMTSERPTDLSALGNATQAITRRRSVIPILRDSIKRVFAFFAPHWGNSVGEPLIESKDTQYQMGANSYSAELYKEMRQAVHAGGGGAKTHLPLPKYSYLVSRPPRIVLKGFLLRREQGVSLMLRGRAIHPRSVRDVMVFADKRKVLYLSSAARNDAGCIEFSADIPITRASSHILVVARHSDEVMGSQSLYVKRDSN